MSARIRLGIAGFGRVAENCYAPALRALDAFDVRVVAERRLSGRVAAGKLFPGAALASDAEVACGESAVDAWLIALPPEQHHRVASVALRRGRHTYVEKPLALKLSQARELVSIARASGCVSATGYVGRFAPAYVELERRLSKPGAPRVTSVRCQLTFDEIETVPWKETVHSGGGALNDIAVHHADLLRFIFRTEVVAVRARCWAERRAGDSAEVEMRLANAIEARGVFSSACASADRVLISGESFEWSAARVAPRSAWLRPVSRVLGRLRGPRPRRPDPAFVNCFAAFARAIRDDSPMIPDLEDGARGVAFLEAAHASALDGRWVDVPAIGGEMP